MRSQASVSLFAPLVFLVPQVATEVTANKSSPVANTTAPDLSAAAGCPCGFFDANTNAVFTESTIVYFNESQTLPEKDLVTETYVHDYEKGWNTFFREAADPENVKIADTTNKPNSTTTLDLYVKPYVPETRKHVIHGASVRSLRRDIKYGSFSSLIRAPGRYAGVGGSTVSMELRFNLTQVLTLNLQNGNTPDDAHAGMLSNEDFPASNYRVPFGNMTNATWGNGTIDPWDYTEYRIDWTEHYVKFFIGGKLAREILREEHHNLLSVPSPIYLRHWSNGNPYYSEGPPKNITYANVPPPIRNNTAHNSELWDSRAATLAQNTPRNRTRAPSITETTLNGDTRANSMTSTSMKKKRMSPRDDKYGKHDSSSTLHGAGVYVDEEVPPLPRNASQISAISFDDSYHSRVSWYSETTPENGDQSYAGRSNGRNEYDRPGSTLSAYSSSDNVHLKRRSMDEATLKKQPSEDQLTITNQPRTSNEGSRRGSSDEQSPDEDNTKWPFTSDASLGDGIVPQSNGPQTTMDPKEVKEVAAGGDGPQMKTEGLTNVPELDKNTQDKKNLPQAKKRVDYLAGLVAFSSLLVTAIHFSLTFVFADINAGAYTHYHSETIARKSIDSFLLNLIWIGPFLMTSTRFLVSSYLKNGDLLPVAEKTVGRAPRLMIPITAMVLLEYFFINAGATKWLEYLPSITWSDWPFTVGYTSFGNFLSEVLELMYLIPNAAPLVTFNYCTGVLWTIPVQLQGSWLALLAVIVIREIKTPWKRFCFYAFCIVNHWYALSFGSYFYIAIMLTDLDLNYKWRTWLHARPIIYYPFLTIMGLMGIAGLFMDFLTQWTEVNYATYEYAIHPDINSGLPISQAGHATYPQYFLPRLNGLAFAVGFQVVVELSPVVQKLLSFKLIVFVFPHIFTIYLFHGFIFWSLGSFLCIQFSVAGLQYWLNILLVAICCYTALALSLPLLTPVVEGLGKSITGDIWKDAREDPVPRQPTLYPFRRDLFLARYQTPHDNSRDMTITKIKDPEKVEEHFDPEVEGVDANETIHVTNQEHGGSANRAVVTAVGKLKEKVPGVHEKERGSVS
ncbi:MAG: hypothetical protein OHK93_003551 [Ramalina farinacea]|uniref:GH16 domain-containing protein n=1 Tax=Ramalina farinacea TaxID=258253 RepID=A0AA43QWQ7_9LECA|nr:hypothetical protein [Ramalina farinacea]